MSSVGVRADRAPIVGRAPRLPGAFVVATAVAAAWAVYASFWRIGFRAVAPDEPTYAEAAWLYINGRSGQAPSHVGAATPANFEHPPLAKLLFGVAQLVAGHRSVVADRLVATTCTLATGVLLAIWIGRVASRWVGLAAGLMVVVIPMQLPSLDLRFGRYGVIDPVAELFMTASVVIAWVWSRRTGRAAWGWAALLGVAVGLATASKMNGFLGAVGPVLLVVSFGVPGVPAARAAGIRAAQALVAAAVCGITLAAAYLPLAHPAAAFAYMVRFQAHQSVVGHLVLIAGHTTRHPPWWAFLWFAAHALGAVIAVATLACVTAAVALRRDRVVLWCVAALIGPLVFHLAIAGVVLPYYFVMWMPAYLALTALGAAELLALAGQPEALARTGGVLAGIACAGALLTGAARDTVRITTMHLTGPPYLPTVMRRAHLRGPVVGVDVRAWEVYGVGVPHGVAYRLPTSLAHYDTVLVSRQHCGMPSNPVERTFLRVNLDAGTLREVYQDDRMTVFARLRPLIRPTADEVSVEPALVPAGVC